MISLTNELSCEAIADCVQKTVKTTCISNSLLEPQDLFVRPRSSVFLQWTVFVGPDFLIRWRDRKDEQEGVSGAGNERKELRVVYREDIVPRKLW